MNITSTHYLLINPDQYQPYLSDIETKLGLLNTNRVTFKNEIHRESRFAICHYHIEWNGTQFKVTYDATKSERTTNEKKTNTDPGILNCDSIQSVVLQFLKDIGDSTLKKAEVKLIQTEVFPFIFNPHRDSQFRRLRHIKYLATVLVSSGEIEGGNMQLFHSENDKIGPFKLIEELSCLPGTGYIVDETPQIIFHGMKPALKAGNNAHRAALLLRFFN